MPIRKAFKFVGFVFLIVLLVLSCYSYVGEDKLDWTFEKVIDNSPWVYITDNNEHYHRNYCDKLANNSHHLTVLGAHSKGYTPCIFCDAPLSSNYGTTTVPDYSMSFKKVANIALRCVRFAVIYVSIYSVFCCALWLLVNTIKSAHVSNEPGNNLVLSRLRLVSNFLMIVAAIMLFVGMISYF